ncbi:hypothetical protein [Streptomyces sp. H39-C1]|uniref:hypothetical protein n=1 Tax=Streptomyces sp. H39-C1 TaxID=3004355 RepID=UPI0022AFFD9E|nr:hypothetical protein [Streptomyces sp. H39-C1]MCZ4100797.1 hypothetical protein [Streptomyces sp. H39-C1]
MNVSAASSSSTAPVIVTLAFFVLVAYLVNVLRTTQRPVGVITAIAGLVGALPAILYALHYAANT